MALREYVSFWVVLFLIFFNAGAGMLGAMGVDGYLGIDPDTGDTGELESAESDIQQAETGTGQGQTLFGLRSRLADTFNTLVNAFNPGAEMMKSAGAPPDIVNFVFAGLFIVPPMELLFFLRRG